jgi:hypothetical protein
MNFLRVAAVKLFALLFIGAGLVGMRANEFSRMYVENATYTISGATPQVLDMMFAEASEGMLTGRRGNSGIVTRERSNNSTTLSIAIQGDTWSDLSNFESEFQRKLEKAARVRNLTINGTSTSSGSRMPDVFKSRRVVFIAFAAVAAFGIAMLVLSFRIFGGGRRVEVPELGLPETADNVTAGK